MDKRNLVIGVGLGLMLACMVLAPVYLIVRGQMTEEIRGLRIQMQKEKTQSPSSSPSSSPSTPAASGLGGSSQSPSTTPSVSPSQSSTAPAVSQTPEASLTPSSSSSSSPSKSPDPTSSPSPSPGETPGQNTETENDSANDSEDDKDGDTTVDNDKTKSEDSIKETGNSDNEKYLAEQKRRYNHYNSLEPENGNAHVYIMHGMTALQVSRLLEERGVVDDAQSFLDYLKEWGYTPKIASGYYLLPQLGSYSATYNQIRTQ